MLCVATIGMHRACRASEKNFSSPDGSFSPVVANAWYSSQTNSTGRRLRVGLGVHPVDAVEHGALKVLFQHRAERARQAGIHGDRES